MYFTQEAAGKLYTRVRELERVLAELRAALPACLRLRTVMLDDILIELQNPVTCPCSICRAHTIIDGVLV